MTDTRARDALAAALIRTGMWVDAYDGPGLDQPEVYAVAILTDEDITPDQRRALAAAFLDAETLAAVLFARYALGHIAFPCGEDTEVEAAAILAALRETP